MHPHKNWLNGFQQSTSPKEKSVKNCFEFAEKIKSVRITRNEEMASYDVTSLYPSVPVEEAIGYLKWLEENRVPKEWIEMYIDFTRICMNQNVFICRGKIYRQTFGVAMG